VSGMPHNLRWALDHGAGPADPRRRGALAEALAAQHPMPDPVEARELERLAEGRVPVLVTGQQAGLAGGLFLTVSKLLGLLALADHAERATGLRPLCVFWLEANDHDWREAATVGHPLPEGWHAPLPTGREGQPVGHIQPDSAWWEARRGELAALEAGLDPELAALWRVSLAGSLADHSRCLLRGLFAASRLLVLDPSRPDLRALAAPFMERVRIRGRELGAALAAETEELRRLGHATPVAVDDQPPWFAEDAQGRRRRATWSGGEAAERRSPGALLRPLLQDWLLEPAAVLLGPTEFAYGAQNGAARRLLDLPEPVALRRPTLQVVPRPDHDALRDAGLDPFAPPRSGSPWPEEWLLGLPGGGELQQGLERIRQATDELERLCRGAGRADLDALATRQEALAGQIRQALWTAHKASHKGLLKDLQARAAWQDGALPQERRVNALALLGRLGGRPVLAGLRRELDPFAPERQRFICDADGRVERVG
jgi:hypothetical protein